MNCAPVFQVGIFNDAFNEGCGSFHVTMISLGHCQWVSRAWKQYYIIYSSAHPGPGHLPNCFFRNNDEPQHCTFPFAMIAILSPRTSASSIKWVVSRIVLLFLIVCRRSHIPRLASGSIPEVGSSSKTTSDPPANAIPRCSFLFMPPDNKTVIGYNNSKQLN